MPTFQQEIIVQCTFSVYSLLYTPKHWATYTKYDCTGTCQCKGINHQTFNVTKGWHLINNVVTELCSTQRKATPQKKKKKFTEENVRELVNSTNRGVLLAQENPCLTEIMRTCG